MKTTTTTTSGKHILLLSLLVIFSSGKFYRNPNIFFTLGFTFPPSTHVAPQPQKAARFGQSSTKYNILPPRKPLQSRIPFIKRTSLSLSSNSNNNNNNNNPNSNEKSQQKLEAIQSLSSYNDGLWTGQSTSFSITDDVASGITKRKKSIPYQTSVSARMSVTDGLTLVETLQWQESQKKGDEEKEDGDDDKERGTCVATRTTKLNKSSDVDSVDGSYSIDVSLLDLPKFITGTNGLVKFAIEKCLATSEEERTRCFLLYGMDDFLFRVVICHETRVVTEEKDQKDDSKMSGEGRSSSSKSSGGEDQKKGDFASILDDDEEMAADIERLVGKITGEITTTTNDKDKEDDDTTTTKKETTSKRSIPKVPGPITAESTVEERMEQLQKALSNANLQNENANDGGGDDSTDNNKIMVTNPMSLFDLSLGVWLGDAVVRDQMIESSGVGFGKKGFGSDGGKSSSSSKSGKSKVSSSSSNNNTPKNEKQFGDGFAEWSMGVQKVAMTYRWNFEDTVRHKLDFGRSMGTYTSDDIPRSSMGNVILDEGMSRKVKPEDRVTYIDYDMGAYAGFIVGSVCIKAPRYLNFSQNGRAQSRPFYTEFAVFHKTIQEGGEEGENENNYSNSLLRQFDENSVPPELYCSRMTRLYSIDGRLSQGSTSFFTLKRMSVEE